MTFYERLSAVMEQQGITPYKAFKDTRISQGTFTRWKNNPDMLPDGHTLVKLADYLDVSLDYLVGRSEVSERR